jgi:RNA methyltransferase, TrmH family
LAEGVKVVRELLKSTWKTRALLILSGREDDYMRILPADSSEVDIYRLSEKEWHRLSQDKNSEGIIAVASIPAMPSLDDLTAVQCNHLLLLHEINNPNNLGALLRTADWFGFRTVLLSAGSVDFTHAKVVRTAMGGLFHLTVLANVDFTLILPMLRKSFNVVGSDARTGVIPHPCIGRTALLFGSESHGLPRHLNEMTDECWCIPGEGEAESLSLPQAAAVMMYACTKT